MATKQAIKKANTQAGISPRSGVAPPANRQFGKKDGNKQGRGFWKKEATARYKLEQMLQLNKSELEGILLNPKSPVFEQKLAQCILNGEWKEIEGMMNQVYGAPKQVVEQKNIDLTPILPKPKKGKK